MKVQEGDFPFRHASSGKLDCNAEEFIKLRDELTEDEDTMIGGLRLVILYYCAAEARGLDGDMAEVGSWRGGTARLIARTAGEPRRIVHLFDTFTGLPEPKEGIDVDLRPGQFGDTSYERVAKFLEDLDNVRIHEGFFPATTGGLERKSFSFVHVDCDLYQSIADGCTFFWDRLVDGGLMVFDDYEYYEGAQRAVDEFFLDLPEVPYKIATGQVIVRRARELSVPARAYTKCPHCGEELKLLTQVGKKG